MIENRLDLFTLVKPDAVCVELGVAMGDFSEEILFHHPHLHLLSIDKWNDHHNIFEYQKTMVRLARFGIRSSVFRLSFDEAIHLFWDASFDLIYCDGYAHTGQENGRTLDTWWPRIKPGGIFAGHDYCPEWQPTVDAVNRFVAKNGLELNIIKETPYNSWWVRKKT